MRAQRLLRWVSLLLVASFALVALDNVHRLGPYRNTGQTVAAPVLSLASDAANQMVSFAAVLGEIGRLNQESRRLRDENRQLTEQNVQLQALGQENAQLRALLSFKQAHPQHAYAPAAVIARGTNNLLPMLTIAAGSADGLKVGMAVVDASGLIGRLSSVAPNVATVLPITNPGSAVPVHTNARGARTSGMVQDEPGAGLVLNYVPATAPLQQGAWLLTSGLGGSYPPDLPVARVDQVRQSVVDLFQAALLTPAADIEHSQTVLVVTDFVPQIPPTEPS